MSFYDKYGNILPNSYQVPKQSENPTTFNVAHFFSKVLHDPEFSPYNTYTRTVAKYKTNPSWRTMEHDPNPDWSIDEKISALAFFSYIKDYKAIKTIPIFPSSNNSSKWSWFRPDIMAYDLCTRWPWLRWTMIPVIIIALKMWLSEMQFKRNPSGESSGIQLNFIMAMGWRDYDYVTITKDTIGQAMNIYYPEPSHPTRMVWSDFNKNL